MTGSVRKPQRGTRYLKPNLNNLRGKRGKRLLKFIYNLPAPQTEELSKNVEKYITDALSRRHDD